MSEVQAFLGFLAFFNFGVLIGTPNIAPAGVIICSAVGSVSAVAFIGTLL